MFVTAVVNNHGDAVPVITEYMLLCPRPHSMHHYIPQSMRTHIPHSMHTHITMWGHYVAVVVSMC